MRKKFLAMALILCLSMSAVTSVHAEDYISDDELKSSGSTSVTFEVQNDPDYVIYIPSSVALDEYGTATVSVTAKTMSDKCAKEIYVKISDKTFSGGYFKMTGQNTGQEALFCIAHEPGGSTITPGTADAIIASYYRSTTPLSGGSCYIYPYNFLIENMPSDTYTGTLYFEIY